MAAAHRSGYVGKYRSIDALGRGSMGVVDRALDETLGREVALKSPLVADAHEADRPEIWLGYAEVTRAALSCQ